MHTLSPLFRQRMPRTRPPAAVRLVIMLVKFWATQQSRPQTLQFWELTLPSLQLLYNNILSSIYKPGPIINRKSVAVAVRRAVVIVAHYIKLVANRRLSQRECKEKTAPAPAVPTRPPLAAKFAVVASHRMSSPSDRRRAYAFATSSPL